METPNPPVSGNWPLDRLGLLEVKLERRLFFLTLPLLVRKLLFDDHLCLLSRELSCRALRLEILNQLLLLPDVLGMELGAGDAVLDELAFLFDRSELGATGRRGRASRDLLPYSSGHLGRAQNGGDSSGSGGGALGARGPPRGGDLGGSGGCAR